MSYRNPRFNVSLLLTFQSSLKYQPKYFLLNAAFAFRLIPDAPPVPELSPVPSRNDAKPYPLLLRAAVGLGPWVKSGPKLKTAHEEFAVFRMNVIPVKP